MAKSPAKVPRNLIVCCDGTSNGIGVNISNAVKLYRILEKDDRQRVSYDPGVGTINQLAMGGRLSQSLRNVLVTRAARLDDNVLDAYRWLVLNYQNGDGIFLFGFSRRAHTVRATAGLINMVGLLRPDQLNITDYGLTAYKGAAEKDDLKIAWQFQWISEGRDVSIHFVGVWDTVASVIVRGPDRFYIPGLQFLPFTGQNKRVRIFRQAFAIDERRRMFCHYRWNDGEEFAEDRFGPEIDQDSRQVWFAVRTPTPAAAIRKPKAGFRNILCDGFSTKPRRTAFG